MVTAKERYIASGVFYIPDSATWESVQQAATKPKVSQMLDKMMEEIEKANPTLKDVLPKVFVRVGIPRNVITELINIISGIDFKGNIEKEKDTLGIVYEYFLGELRTKRGCRWR